MAEENQNQENQQQEGEGTQTQTQENETQTPQTPPKAPEETLKDIEKRIDDKLLKLKTAEYEAKLRGQSQVAVNQSQEEKTKAECNEYLKGTGFSI